MHEHAKSLQVTTRFISEAELRREEPDVQAREAILESSSTGIVDSHGFMVHLLGKFEELGGDVAYNTNVIGLSVRPHGGFNVICKTETGEEISIDAGVVVNSAGLYACTISNMLLSSQRHLKPYYAKGNYFSYASSKPKPKRLIYPCPDKNYAG
jgi:2-hydroxyglutarate dehydrogenase